MPSGTPHSPFVRIPSAASGRGPRVAIIGGGVIGLALGWHLLQQGAAVTLVERGQAGQGASHAAGGMLAASLEAEPTEEALFAFGRWSQTLWPGFARAVEAASDRTIGYDTTGTLMAAFTRDQAARLRRGLDFQRRLGARVELLDAQAARMREPALAPSLIAAGFGPDDHVVDNRLLAAALAEAFRRAGGRLIENAAAALDLEAGRAVGVLATTGEGETTRFPADVTVLAAGAWSGQVEGVPPVSRPPVRPVKGQMLALRMPPLHLTGGAPLLRHVVWGASCYLIPRGDGRLVVGATSEERGFDDTLTAGGVYGLLDDAWRTLPAIEDLPIVETWTGFRPGSPDDQPVLGPSGTEGLLLATGHHRNGILLTPATAAVMADYILTGQVPAEMAPFLFSRFTVARRAFA